MKNKNNKNNKEYLSIIRKVVNNNIMFTILTFLLIFSFIMVFISRTEADSSNSYNKSFMTIEIGNGDTLTSIAEEYAISPAQYNEYIEEVKFINNLNSDTIHYGCYLLIPVYNPVYN